MLETYDGSCHCGRVRFRVQADLSTLLECNCSVCTKKGILHLIVPPEQFELLQGEEDLATYQFNTNTAKHTFCRACGMHPFYVPRSDPDKISVNARCLDGVDPATLRPSHFFDGRNWEEAQRARRAPKSRPDQDSHTLGAQAPDGFEQASRPRRSSDRPALRRRQR